VVLPGTGRERQYTAELFCKKNDGVPSFIKKNPGAWEHVGYYRVHDSKTDAASSKKHHRGSITPVNKVTRVMFLERAQ
jgi:hypothetical protein